MPDLSASLADFVTYVGKHLTGDEKGEAADFLDHFFRALGHDGIKEAGATRETRLAKKGGGKGKNFADLLWPQRVLIEMKSRGKKLERHYDQIFDYWTHIVPHRPPYVILCNFDEFWIYDFNIQLFDPVEKIALADLPHRAEALAFLLPKPRKPLFNNNRVEVSRVAANDLAKLFRSLVARGEDRTCAQRFILQLLVTLVSEDMSLLPRQILTRLIAECREKGESAYDLIGGLFRQMDSKTPARAGRFADVPYFNGGLFSVIDPIDLLPAELEILATVADQKWDLVKPEIFGTLFQSSMDAGERHAFGAHFTSEFDIQKVVGPTIVRPWRARMAEAWNDMDALMKVLNALRAFRVLDPACGSGNFLAVAYREMKRLEQDILNRLRELSKFIKVKGSKVGKSVPPEALMNAVSIQQFYGMDLLPFAAELAKVTLMVAKEMWVMENSHADDSESLFARETPLPLDNLDQNILCADALFTEWPKADAIIGNPPYLDARKMTMEYGAEYTTRLRKLFPEIPGRADLCVYWFRKAHDHLLPEGRSGLVGTNSVRQNYSREGGLDYVVGNGGTITDAISTQVWSGDAAVHVSIVNWIKGDSGGVKNLVFQRGDSVDSPWESHQIGAINSALSLRIDVSEAKRLKANTSPKVCLEGQQPGHTGFCINSAERTAILTNDAKSEEVLHPILNGTDLLTAAYVDDPSWVIDFREADLFGAMRFPGALGHVKATVLELWTQNAEQESVKTGKTTGEHQNRLKCWWQLKRRRAELIVGISKLTRYFVCSAVTKRPIYEFLSNTVRPSNALKAFLFADDYSFGVIQSSVHSEWFIARCSTLESRLRYTPDTVFDTFPWPQSPTRKQIEAVAKEAVALRQLRREVMAKMNWSLRDLYRTLEEPGSNPLRDAQAKLDAAVRAAYGMPKDADILAFLLALNQSCAAKEAAGESITPPGLPLPLGDHGAFITKDCIRMS